MSGVKANIEVITQLRRDLLLLQGFHSTVGNAAIDLKLGPIKDAFPYGTFPVGAIHEFVNENSEVAAVTSDILSSLMEREGVCVWIRSSHILFPSAF